MTCSRSVYVTLNYFQRKTHTHTFSDFMRVVSRKTDTQVNTSQRIRELCSLAMFHNVVLSNKKYNHSSLAFPLCMRVSYLRSTFPHQDRVAFNPPQSRSLVVFMLFGTVSPPFWLGGLALRKEDLVVLNSEMRGDFRRKRQTRTPFLAVGSEKLW